MAAMPPSPRFSDRPGIPWSPVVPRVVTRTGTDSGQRGTRRKLDVDRPVLCIGMLMGFLVGPYRISGNPPQSASKSLLLKCAPEYNTAQAAKELKQIPTG